MPLSKQLARKYFNEFFQNHSTGRHLTPNKRVALCVPISGGRFQYITAVSGSYYEPSVTQETMDAFHAMLKKHNVQKLTNHDPINCAEAHLWLRLVDMSQLPRHLDVYVAKKQTGKPRAKRDSPCRNCQQWARQEFHSLNQV
ncbi:MAG: hypothetical protein MK102_05630 [Fuerstiella sp.]|nr:hypothetical protein [Fuerstiella sp.]